MSDNGHDRREPGWGAPENSPRSRGDDPLAELARLIDEDPFADFDRRRREQAEGRAPDPAPRSGAADIRHEPRPVDPAYDDSSYDDAAYDREPDAFAGEDEPRRADFDPAAALEASLFSGSQQPAHATRETYEEPAWPARQDVDWQAEDVSSGQHEAFDAGYADSAYDYPGNDPIYADDGHMPPYDGEYESQGRSRRGVVVMGGLVGLVILGGAVALAYRGFGGEAGGPPPVIEADSSPAKTEPETAATDDGDGQGKLVYDRVGGDSATGETRLVSREEPVFDVGGDRPVRMIETNQDGALRGSADGTETAGGSDGGLGEPTRVRTVIVRPDGTIVSNPGPAPEPEPARQSADTAANDGGTPSIIAPEPVREEETAFVPPSAPGAPEPQPAPSAGGQPLQLAPGNDAPAPTQPPQQVAQAPTTEPQAPASAQTANFPSGSFVVQVAASRSENEARGTASAIGQRYGDVLSGYDPAVERADLGDRGIYYRVAVGPIGGQAEASSLCERLKSAGVDCFVRRN